MKEKPLLIIVIVVFLFLALGASAFALKSYNDAKAQKAQQALEALKAPVQEAARENQLKDKAQEKLQGSLFDIFNKGGDMQCTFSGAQEGSDISGTIYVSGKKMKGVFEIEAQQAAIKSNVLSDGTYMYTWTDLLPTGLKMKLSDVEAASGENTDPNSLSPEALNNMKNFQQQFDYDCKDWSVESAMFIVPTDVTFTDFSLLSDPGALLDKAKDKAGDAVKEAMDGEGNAMCSKCNLIPDPEAKAACLTNFQCN